MLNLLSRVLMAYRGRRMWKKLKGLYGIGSESVLVVMPENDLELNSLALRNINHLTANRKVSKAVILSEAGNAENALAGGEIVIVSCKSKELEDILAFYELYKFTEYVVVVSLSRPFGNMAHLAIGAANLTIEMLLGICVFGIRNWVQA